MTAKLPMTRENALAILKVLQRSDDPEVAHVRADDIICELLETLGYADVVVEYHGVDKWYS